MKMQEQSTPMTCPISTLYAQDFLVRLFQLLEDGKDFVPETSSAETEEAVNLGLFPSQTDWKSPMSKEEAAGLAVDLLAIMERG